MSEMKYDYKGMITDISHIVKPVVMDEEVSGGDSTSDELKVTDVSKAEKEAFDIESEDKPKT